MFHLAGWVTRAERYFTSFNAYRKLRFSHSNGPDRHKSFAFLSVCQSLSSFRKKWERTEYKFNIHSCVAQRTKLRQLLVNMFMFGPVENVPGLCALLGLCPWRPCSSWCKHWHQDSVSVVTEVSRGQDWSKCSKEVFLYLCSDTMTLNPPVYPFICLSFQPPFPIELWLIYSSENYSSLQRSRAPLSVVFPGWTALLAALLNRFKSGMSTSAALIQY